MNYPENIEEKIGFDQIRTLLKNYTQTDLGRIAINKISFSNQRKKIEHAIDLVLQMDLLYQSGEHLEFFESIEQVQHIISALDKEGVMIYEDDLLTLKSALNCFQNNFKTIEKKSDLVPMLFHSQEQIMSVAPCVQLIDKIIDIEGNIKNDASPLLKEINKKIQVKEKEVRKTLLSKFEYAKKNGWAGDTEITIRNERLVIPIIAEFKKKINGFVHDDSQSGKYLYIEPIECFEENNALKEIHFERKKEIERILKQLAKDLSPYKQNIWQHTNHTVFLDVIASKLKLSTLLKSIKPDLVHQQNEVRLKDARHPLLFIQLHKDNKKIVPLNFEPGKNHFLILISGPNAGGKSISLKTIALLQYMLQSGLPVPLSIGSKMMIFNQIFIDIGDNQSIENNLSSYSSHLHNMKFFMKNIDDKTLYLIDELGNGTDPSIGTSIAQAILEVLITKKSLGIITTHFGELKAWANETNGVLNARMLYDLKNLEPLFELELGKQGSSFALEVASKVGIESHIIERVKKINLWKNHIDLEELLAENEKNKIALADNNKRIQERELVLNKLIQDYQVIKDELQLKKHSILNDAKQKASNILNESNQKIEETIRDIKMNQAEKQKTKVIRKQLEHFKEQVKPDLIKPKNSEESIQKEQVIVGEIKKGSIVKQIGSSTKGEVIEIKGKKAQVLFGDVKMQILIENLELTIQTHQKKNKSNPFNHHIIEKQKNFRADLDLRGVRGEEALAQLEGFISDALLLGMNNLRIVHGRGHGILKKLIAENLRKNNSIQSFHHESEQTGGDGVTIVVLK